MRLDKFLSDMNMGSRKELRQKIRKGTVLVNGEKAADPGMAVTAVDEVFFDGEKIDYRAYEYYMLNKPAGLVTATEDRFQKTVLDLFGESRRKDLFPVGRLDKDTVGLLLITNDGDLNHRLLSPKKHVDKEYYVHVSGRVDEQDIRAFGKGIRIDEVFTALPAELKIISYRETASGNDAENFKRAGLDPTQLIKGVSEVMVTIQEGKFHQIKRMFHSIGKEVVYLKRLRMGTLVLDSRLEEGGYRHLTEDEIAELKNTH